MLKKRRGIRRVPACTVFGRVPLCRSKGDEGRTLIVAFRLHALESSRHLARAALPHGSRQLLHHGVVATRVQKYEVRLASHEAKDYIERHRPEEIDLFFHFGVNRHQEVLPPHLQAVAGIEE